MGARDPLRRGPCAGSLRRTVLSDVLPRAHMCLLMSHSLPARRRRARHAPRMVFRDNKRATSSSDCASTATYPPTVLPLILHNNFSLRSFSRWPATKTAESLAYAPAKWLSPRFRMDLRFERNFDRSLRYIFGALLATSTESDRRRHH